MKKTFCIGDICVGDDKRALVIPEIGINHEGSLLLGETKRINRPARQHTVPAHG